MCFTAVLLKSACGLDSAAQRNVLYSNAGIAYKGDLLVYRQLCLIPAHLCIQIFIAQVLPCQLCCHLSENLHHRLTLLKRQKLPIGCLEGCVQAVLTDLGCQAASYEGGLDSLIEHHFPLCSLTAMQLLSL